MSVAIDGATTKIGRYNVADDSWGFVHYPLEPKGDGGWIGLTELTLLPDGTFAVVERDKGWGPTTPPTPSSRRSLASIWRRLIFAHMTIRAAS